MHSALVIADPASDLQLLTIAEMRSAAGVTGTSQDAELRALGLRVAALISAECNIAVGSNADGAPATLKQETLQETFRLVDVDKLVLARRHEVIVSSLVVDGTELGEDDFVVDPEGGMLVRIREDTPARWCASKIVATYLAGFETTVPGELKQAALDVFRWLRSAESRDPLIKGEVVEIPDVMTRRSDYWVGAIPGGSTENIIPGAISGKLSRFRNFAI